MLDARLPRRAAGPAATPRPRVAFLSVPKGVVHDAWKPTAAETDYELTSSLEPLAPICDRKLVITGLSQIPDGDRQTISGLARPTAALRTGTVVSEKGVRPGRLRDDGQSGMIGQCCVGAAP